MKVCLYSWIKCESFYVAPFRCCEIAVIWFVFVLFFLSFHVHLVFCLIQPACRSITKEKWIFHTLTFHHWLKKKLVCSLFMPGALFRKKYIVCVTKKSGIRWCQKYLFSWYSYRLSCKIDSVIKNAQERKSKNIHYRANIWNHAQWWNILWICSWISMKILS